ncbi:MAG: CFI-box-CTERM domain-containing protein [Microcoleus sp.]
MAKIFSEIDCISYGSMDSFQKATNYCIEAKKYQQVQFYQKAIEAYSEALTYFMFFLESAEVGDVVCLDSQIMLLFWLLGLVDKVKECYGKLSEPYKSLIFQNKLEEIVETIGKYEKNLSPEQFIAYKNLSKGIKLIYEEIPLEASKAVLENLSQVVDNSDDPTFIEMVSNYDKCCSYKTLLVPSKGVSISSSSSSCFIATAAYSTSAHPDIDTFRNFRDKKLLTNPVGQVLVSLYYKISPSIANYVKRQPVIKSFLRQQLERLAEWMRSREVKS